MCRWLACLCARRSSSGRPGPSSACTLCRFCWCTCWKLLRTGNEELTHRHPFLPSPLCEAPPLLSVSYFWYPSLPHSPSYPLVLSGGGGAPDTKTIMLFFFLGVDVIGLRVFRCPVMAMAMAPSAFSMPCIIYITKDDNTVVKQRRQFEGILLARPHPFRGPPLVQEQPSTCKNFPS